MNNLNKKLCDEWNSNKNINPITKRNIKSNGPVYNNIEKNCNKINSGTKKQTNKGEKNICDEWLKNPSINPETGKSIKKNGPVFKKLTKLCKEKINKSKSSSDMSVSSKTKKLCSEWKNNPTINPETGYKIKIDGPKYNYFKNLCLNLNKKVKSSSSNISYHTPPKSFSSSSSRYHSIISNPSSSNPSFHSFKSSLSSYISFANPLLSNDSNHKKSNSETSLENEIIEKISSLVHSSSHSSNKSRKSEEESPKVRQDFFSRLFNIFGF